MKCALENTLAQDCKFMKSSLGHPEAIALTPASVTWWQELRWMDSRERHDRAIAC